MVTGRSLRILVVDDDAGDRAHLARVLDETKLGFVLDQAAEPEEANRKLRRTTYACVLIDYSFPTGRALALFRDLLTKSCARRPPVVILTGSGDELCAAAAINGGAQDYLPKSELEPRALRRVLEGAMQQAVLQRRVEERETALEQMSLFDSLTGLPNRYVYMDRLEQLVRAAARRPKRFAVMMLDLNGFKEVNDSLGHEAGDAVLQQVGRRLTGAVRRSDTAARLGGDEFAMLLPGTDSVEGALVMAEKLCQIVAEPITLGHHIARVGLSVGIALYPEHGREGRVLLRNADDAMYRAKRGSRGFAVFSRGGSAEPTDSAFIAWGLSRAIERDELVVHFQPQVRLSNRRLSGAEALVRWEHPELGLLAPGRFVPAAERTAAIAPMTDRVVELALIEAKGW